MQTGIAVHDPDTSNAMNSDSNHGGSRKEKQMNAITKTTFVTVLVTLGLALAAGAAEAPKAHSQDKKDAAGVGQTSWAAPVPGFVPVQPGEHPRLLFRKTDLPAIKARAQTPEGRKIVERLKATLGGGEAMPVLYNASYAALGISDVVVKPAIRRPRPKTHTSRTASCRSCATSQPPSPFGPATLIPRNQLSHR